MIRICDKCKKPTVGNKFWNSKEVYTYGSPKKPLKINDQTVEMKLQIVLACGQELDLCDDCARKIIHARTKYTK